MAEPELTGKVAIVTGAGRLRGIGRATAVSLAQLGCDVVVTGTGRDPSMFPPDEKAAGWKDIESTAEQVRAIGRRCLPVMADVSRDDDVRRMVNETLREFGHIDVLVNNAAYARGPDRVPVVEMDEGIFRRVLEVKIVGTFLCSRTVAKVLIEQGQGGRIVNLSSIAGKVSGANTSAYAAANAAAEALTRSMARELARYDITVNAVCPGPIDTSRMDDLGREERWETYVKSRVPLGRAGTDEEIGDFIAFLCTKKASWITGQSINIDGGVMMER